ncbi:MAG: hypothetical protein ACT4N2_01935 [Hyphomicrobium sp.]
MLAALVRVLFGFLVACVAGGFVQAVFAMAPDGLPPGPAMGELVLLTATHFAVFSAPFALVVAAVGEWQSIRNWAYYAAGGIAVAIAGFFAQYSSESVGPTILNDYAARAFLTPGFVGGFVYWILAGRQAGDDTGSAPTTGTNAQGGTKRFMT